MKNCSNKDCKQINPQTTESFKQRPNGNLKSWCKICDTIYSKKWKALNKDKVKSWNAVAAKAWRKSNPNLYKGTNLKKYWPNLSGKESFEAYNKLIDLQHSKCNICQKHQSELKYSLCVDHCHKTNKVRGLLCDNCNQALGLLKDDIESLKRAIKHIE
jgi:hypothetical protein